MASASPWTQAHGDPSTGKSDDGRWSWLQRRGSEHLHTTRGGYNWAMGDGDPTWAGSPKWTVHAAEEDKRNKDVWRSCMSFTACLFGMGHALIGLVLDWTSRLAPSCPSLASFSCCSSVCDAVPVSDARALTMALLVATGADIRHWRSGAVPIPEPATPPSTHHHSRACLGRELLTCASSLPAHPSPAFLFLTFRC